MNQITRVRRNHVIFPEGGTFFDKKINLPRDLIQCILLKPSVFSVFIDALYNIVGCEKCPFPSSESGYIKFILNHKPNIVIQTRFKLATQHVIETNYLINVYMILPD